MYVEQFRLTRNFAFFRSRGSDEAHDLHIHDCLEIGALIEDELEYRFGGRTYRGRPGDVFLCRPFEPHWSFAKPGAASSKSSRSLPPPRSAPCPTAAAC